MKQEFLDFINKLMEANPELTASLMNDNIKAYLAAICDNEAVKDKPMFTENGKNILRYMQENDIKLTKSKDIAEGMGIASRSVTGAIKKLVTDGFVEKFGESPILYSITEKGKEIKIEEEVKEIEE